MNNLQERFYDEMIKNITQLWDINNSNKCKNIDLSLPNFSKTIHDKKLPELVYKINLQNGTSVDCEETNSSFKDFLAHLSKVTLQTLLENKNPKMKSSFSDLYIYKN
tara:strand:- start:8569 stop:8889 length:321 start_codon:yes stop_codon:yes gene_type:complete